MIKLVREFCRHNAGATAIEYGLILALICLAIVGGFSALSSNIQTTFQTASNNLAAH